MPCVLQVGVLSVSRVAMTSFIAERVNSIFFNLRCLRFGLLNYGGNSGKLCVTFDRDFKDISL